MSDGAYIFAPPGTSSAQGLANRRSRFSRQAEPLQIAGGREAARERKSARALLARGSSGDFANHNIVSDLEHIRSRLYYDGERASVTSTFYNLPPTSLIAANKRDCLSDRLLLYRGILANNYSNGYG